MRLSTVPFLKAVDDVTGGNIKIQRKDYQQAGILPVIDQGQEEVAGYTDNIEAAFQGSLPVILFGDHTRIFKYVDKPFALGADGVKILAPRDGFDAKFIYYYLLSCDIPSRGYSRHFKFLKEQAIPVFVPSEQRRIVEILDEADQLRRLRREADAKAARILPALFLKMFGDPATNPKGWPVEVLGRLGKLDRGKSKHRPRNEPRLLGGPYPFIQTGDVANSNGYISSFSTTYSEFGLAQSRLWPRGTLCITIAANIAASSILDIDACFPDSVVGFTPGTLTNVAYIRVLLGFLKPILEARASQVAQKNINLEVLRELHVPVPSKELQSDFFLRHESVSKLDVERAKVGNRLEKLWVSLLERAFSGQLTAKWREAHIKELLAEMEQQTRLLNLSLPKELEAAP